MTVSDYSFDRVQPSIMSYESLLLSGWEVWEGRLPIKSYFTYGFGIQQGLPPKWAVVETIVTVPVYQGNILFNG